MRRAAFEPMGISGPTLGESWVTGWGKEVMGGEGWKGVLLVRKVRQGDSPQSLGSQPRSDAGGPQVSSPGSSFPCLDLLGMLLSGFKIQCLD